MDKSMAPDYLAGNTLIFAQSVIQTIMDMTGKAFELDKPSFKKEPFSPAGRVICSIRFSGAVQGGFFLCMDETTALKLIDAHEDGMTEADIREMREDFGGFTRELLNIAVGQVIVELEQHFDGLTYLPPVMIYGELDFPAVQSGTVHISGEDGRIQCVFFLDFTELKLSRKYEKILFELDKQKKETGRYRSDMEKIMFLLPCSLVAVDMTGRILPGYSITTPSLMGYPYDEDITGMAFPDFLKLDPAGAETINDFFKMLCEADVFSFETLFRMCEGEFFNTEGKKYRLEWLPVTNEETGKVEKLMVIVKEQAA